MADAYIYSQPQSCSMASNTKHLPKPTLLKLKKMAHFLLLCFLLANAFQGLAIATAKTQMMVQSISNPPSEPPFNGQSPIRKLGKHQYKQLTSFVSPTQSPSEAPQSEEKPHSSKEESKIPSHQRTSVEPQNEDVLGDSHGHIHLANHNHHHAFDKSVAGGGVILGGLATTFLVAVFCYIRATGRHKSETASTTS